MTKKPKTAPSGGIGLRKISHFIDDTYEPSVGFEPGFALLQRLGVEYTDLRGIPVGNSYEAILNVANDDLDTLQRLLKKFNLKVGGLGTPLFKCPLRGSGGPAWGPHHHMGRHVTYQHYLDALPRAFALADRFGTENIRCFAFWREYQLDDVFYEVVEKLARAARIAQVAGHRLYLENEMTTMAGTGIELARILKTINMPSLVGLYDDGNTGRLGGTIHPDDYDALRGRIGHIHIKHRRINVLCGWMSPAQAHIDQSADYSPYVPPWHHSPYFLWHEPEVPIKGEIKFGDKTFEISGQQTIETVTRTVVDYYRPWFRSLRREGYGGLFAIDNSWAGLPTRTIAEKEADIRKEVEDLSRLIDEVWSEEPESETTSA